MKSTTSKLVMAAMFAAFCCVATMIIKIPTPPFGYINMGDVIVLVAGFVMSPLYGFFAAATGSAFADVFLGYHVYAPVTFFIKGIMALIAYSIYKHTKNKLKHGYALFLAALVAEIFMVVGYYVYEGFLYGFVASLANVPLNSIQALVAIVLSTLLVNILKKRKINF